MPYIAPGAVCIGALGVAALIDGERAVFRAAGLVTLVDFASLVFARGALAFALLAFLAGLARAFFAVLARPFVLAPRFAFGFFGIFSPAFPTRC